MCFELRDEVNKWGNISLDIDGVLEQVPQNCKTIIKSITYFNFHFPSEMPS